MKVAVTGGTGFVGPAVIEEMLRAGHEVVAIEHTTPAPIGEHERLTRVKADVTDRASLTEAFAGCDAVAHLVAIIREDKKKGATFERIHLEGTRNVIDAAKAAGVKRFLLMSANGVDSALDTPYFRTKREMERMLKDTDLEWTIFRPSYISGSDEGGFDAQFADIVDKAPILPSFAGGHFEIQPVSRKNVGEAFARALTTQESIHHTYTLVGPDRMTWNEYLRRLATVRRRHKPMATVPRGAILTIAKLAGPLFPADPDQLRMMMLGNIGDPSESVRDLHLELEPWDSAVSGLRR